MSEPDAFQSRPNRRLPGPACTVGEAVKQIGPDHPLRRLEEVLLLDSGWSSSDIAQRLKENGYPINAITVRRHRRRYVGEGCACP